MKFFKFISKLVIFIIVSFLLFKAGVFIYLKFTPKLEIGSANNILVYDNMENLFFEGNESKKWTSLDKISNYAIDATVYTEDKHFYSHNGFDYLRILKAGVINITSGKTKQGASTITQQYAKNLFLDFDKTWKRKWDEMWYTIKIENTYSKDEILEGYLNTINYGHGMYGIENASKFYFNKSANELSLAEATMITGIPKSPSNYSPIVDFNTAKERQLLVLNSLVENNIITEDEKNNAYNEELNIVGEKQVEQKQTLMYFHDAVLDELDTISEIPKSLTETKGLKIYTTLDLSAQTNLEKNIQSSIPNESKIQTSAVMMDPNNGAVLALVGGRNYNESSYNRATYSKRQVGSTMKPYLYYAALENGFTSSTSFTSQATTFNLSNNQTYSPKNYNDVYGNKPISMATAIAYSDNIYAVKTHLFLGQDSLINVAKRVGISSSLENIPSLPLGTNEIGILEMAAGYSAFANLGYKVNPHLITKIEDKDGNVLYEYKEKKTAVLNQSLCFILNNMLTATYDKSYIDYNYPTGIGLASKMTHTYALKSGTTSTDNWNIGYTPEVLTAVWIGYDDNTELKTSEYKYSQNIWLNSMEDYLKDKESNWYKKPGNISEVLVNPITGKPAVDTDAQKKIMYFIKGTEPSNADPVFDEKFNNSVAS
ncbi:MAG: PBP1A family penicillin-binding protein [Bacilli bacterium]|nr:PBP1A family penicillin-binding protein [Bacilli bacterium]